MRLPASNCPEAGAWRAWLDHRATQHLVDADRLAVDRLGAHLAECLACQRTVSGLRAARADVDASLAGLGPSVVPTSTEVAQARVRLTAARALTVAGLAAERGSANDVAVAGAAGRGPAVDVAGASAGGRGVSNGIAAVGGLSSEVAAGRGLAVDVAGAGAGGRGVSNGIAAVGGLSSEVAGGRGLAVDVAGAGAGGRGVSSDVAADGGRSGVAERGGAIDSARQAQTGAERWARRGTAWRVAAGGLAAAIVLSLVVALTPGGQSAALAFLSQFRTQTVAPIAVSARSQAELVRTMNALGRLGTVSLPNGETRPEAVPRGLARQTRTVSLADASTAVGFRLRVPDPSMLPAHVSPTPEVQVTPGQSIQFTFDKARASAYLASIGRADVVVPDRFDGATLAVTIPTVALLRYGDPSSRETVIVGEAGELSVDVIRGKVGLDELRTFLLSLPGLPSDVVTQLGEISNWSNTLPVPVPVDIATWQRVSIGGNPGLLLNDNSGLGSAAIWHADGHLFGVAGSIRATDLQRIANSLVPAS